MAQLDKEKTIAEDDLEVVSAVFANNPCNKSSSLFLVQKCAVTMNQMSSELGKHLSDDQQDALNASMGMFMAENDSAYNPHDALSKVM
jgi:hypothetical protein